jgi:hypothetical protein
VGFLSAGRVFALTVALALAVPASASAATLYDQLDNVATGTGSASDSYFYPMGENVQVADDFTVPAGQAWQVTGALAKGPIGNYDFIITLFADAGGAPGSQVFQTQSTTPGSTGTTYTFPVSGVPQLQAGHYWISIQLMNLAVWQWPNRTVQSGSPAMLQNPDGAEFATCTTWKPRTQCQLNSSAFPDQAFALSGDAVPVSAPTATKKKCKKHKKKHKRFAESAKKKCKKKKRK